MFCFVLFFILFYVITEYNSSSLEPTIVDDTPDNQSQTPVTLDPTTDVISGNQSQTPVTLDPTTDVISGNKSQTAVTLVPTTEDVNSGNISTTTVIPETTTTEGKLLNGASLYSSR